MKTFLKIAANALGAIGTLAALINPRAVFGVEQPAAFLFLVPAVILGLIAYFMPGRSRFPDVGVVTATLVLIAFAASRFSPIRSQLILAEHLGTIRFLGMGDRADLYRPTYGPKLIRSEKVMSFHEGLLREYPDVETILKDHGRYALVYAGRRVRGESDDAIFAGPIGPRLFLGTLVSETFEPYWWPVMDWLKRDLAMKPTPEWKMGLLPPDWAKAKYQQLAANPPLGDSSMIEGLLYVALRRPGFATNENVAAILDAWTHRRARAGEPVGPVVAAARTIAASLSAKDGTASVRFDYPAAWSEAMRAVFTADLLRFLEAGGVHANASPSGVPILVTAAPREWGNVSYVYTDEQYRTIRYRTHPIIVGHGLHISGYDTSRQVIERTMQESRGRLGVPTLSLRVGEAVYAFAPVSTISKQMAEALWSCDPSKPRVGSTRESEEQQLADLVLAPWRFGIQAPNEDNNRSKRSSESLY